VAGGADCRAGGAGFGVILCCDYARMPFGLSADETMTPQIALVLAILGLALFLFVTEKLRADLVALVVLCLLGILGLVTPTEALEGFSNPAVVTIWAMFILSAGLAATGVADFIGERMLSVSGHRDHSQRATPCTP
jgi:di/tricarboxylate transporter